MENKEQLLAFMNEIDPALVEEVELNGRKRRMSAPLRAGLIAACVCAALVGTVCASDILLGITMGPPTTLTTTKYEGDIPYESTATGIELILTGISSVPQDQLTEAFRSAVLEWSQTDSRLPILYDTDWGDLAGLIGIPLPDNEILQAEPSRPFKVTPFVIDGNLLSVEVFGLYNSNDVSISAMAFFDIEGGVDTLPERIFNVWGERSEVLNREYYTMPDGSIAVIETVQAPSIQNETESVYYSSAHFVKNGGLFYIDTQSNESNHEGRELLEDILNSFA